MFITLIITYTLLDLVLYFLSYKKYKEDDWQSTNYCPWSGYYMYFKTRGIK